MFVQRPERLAFDARLALREDGGWPRDLVMVSIDDPTLIRHGRWPWAREQLGEFLEAVKGFGAKTILLDVILAAPSSPESDASLTTSLSRTHPILGAGLTFTAEDAAFPSALGAALSPTQAWPGTTVAPQRLVIPMPAFASAAGGLGHAAFFANPKDGQVRGHTPFLAIAGTSGSLPSTALVAYLAQRGFRPGDSRLDPDALTLPTGARVAMSEGAFNLDLVPGGPRPLTVSARDILEAKDPHSDPLKRAAIRAALAGKLALVHVDSVYTPDLFSSPVADRTTGGLLIAYAIRTFDGGRTPRGVPLWPVAALAVAIALVAARPLSARPPGVILGAAAGASILYVLVACVLVRMADAFLPVMAPALFFVLAGGLLTAHAGHVAEVERDRMRQLLASVKRAYGGDDEGTVRRPAADGRTRPGAAVRPGALSSQPTESRPPGAVGAVPTGSRAAELGVGTETRRGSGANSGSRSGAERLVGGDPLDEPVQIGQYDVQRSLGRGGMGAIFLAIDRDLDRPVAIKILESVSKEAYVRFRREAMAVARISHPNVVQVYEVGLDSTVPFIVMEYAAGGTLSDLLRDPDVPSPLSWERATRLASGIAKGLGAAHVKGIVHRDLKPANVLLTSRKSDFPKLADFGIAKLSGADELTREGLVVGTVGYLSPEQALGKPVDTRSDIYSLAVMYYRMLTGKRAFEGTTEELLRVSVTVGLPDPRDANPNVPAAIAELLVRMGSLDRERRPMDGNVVAAALDLILAGAGSQPPAAPP